MAKPTQDSLNLKSAILLKMSDHGRKVARILTHCSPQKHLNFLVTMFDMNDFDHVGGELGGVHDASKGHVSFLSTNLKSMVMKADDEFEAGLGLGWR